MRLRWLETSEAHSSPLLHKENNCEAKQSERIPMIPRVTHTRLPEGRQDFKLRATGGVRLGESTNLTIACLLMLKGFILPNCRLCAAPSCWLSLRSKVVRCCEKDILLSNSWSLLLHKENNCETKTQL